MKYLGAYSIPIVGILGIYFGGIWSYGALLFAFVAIPIMELLLPINKDNYDEETILERTENRFFDVLLYLNVPIVYGSIIYSLIKITQNNLSTFEIVGITLSLGIILGANGINVAHELGHRKN